MGPDSISPTSSSGNEKIVRQLESNNRNDIADAGVDADADDDSLPSEKEEPVEPLNNYTVVPGKPAPPIPGPQEDYLVTFAEDDPERPINWPTWKRVLAKAVATINIAIIAWGSSAISPGLESDNGVEHHFHLGGVPATLTISLYVLGFALGPIVWGPASEMFGRQPPLIIGMFGYAVFAFACATAKDTQTLMICRFFMGAFGTTALVVGPAISADVFNTAERGKAISFVILVLNCGPMVAPAINGYIAFDLGWRWTMYISAFMGCVGLILQVFVGVETYPQAHLKFRAVKLRHETGNWAISAPLENMELDTMNIIERTILKPMRLLAVEPILFLMSLYMGFVYSILYMLFVSLPIIFGEHYGWMEFEGNARGNTYLPFLAMFVGCFIMVCTQLFVLEKIQAKMLERTGLEICPETRLLPMMINGFFLPIGLFLTCWSAEYRVHWIVPCVGLAFVGSGIIGIFQAGLIYVIDTYLLLAASAVSANTFLRSGMAAAFPLFTAAMFHNLGIQWAGTLLGCLAALLAPVPFVFYIWGDRIRAMSKFAAGPGLDREDLMVEMTADPASRIPTSLEDGVGIGEMASRTMSRPMSRTMSRPMSRTMSRTSGAM